MGRLPVARRAKLAVRFARVELDLHGPRGIRWQRLPLWAVHVREVGTTPAGEPPLDWMLLTTFAVDTLADAKQVIHSYATRWAIEEFHKTWKSGACNLEAKQLLSFANICRWAAVAGLAGRAFASSAGRAAGAKTLMRGLERITLLAAKTAARSSMAK